MFGLVPGVPRCPAHTPLSLPVVGRRLHGDGFARVLLHLLIAQLRGEGCAGGCVSREVRACVLLQGLSPCGGAWFAMAGLCSHLTSAERVAFPACSACVAHKAEEVSLHLHDTLISMVMYLYVYVP